jgi:uncharacterized protein
MVNYYKYSDYLKKRFGTRVRKVSVDAGFSCPNIDGKISTAGCIYCDNKAFSFHKHSQNTLTVEDQIKRGIEYARKHFKAEKFIVYFQAHTNTYAALDKLRDRYDVIRKFKDVVSMSIATRPDCINEEVLGLISEYSKDYEVWIEYGLQSMHDKTLEYINRGHNYNDFLSAFSLTRKYPIKVCTHVILGLPAETETMMLETADELTRIKVDAAKIHPLHVVKGTALENLYNNGLYNPLGFDEYANLLKSFLKRLSPDIIIQRLSAYCPKDMLVAPEWINIKPAGFD